MKRMLFLGGSHAEIPMIEAAKELGYYVITSGNQKDGMGHAYADEYIACDYSDREAVLTLASMQHVDAVCAGCNDFAALSAAYVCEKLGLAGHDSYETSLRLHHKDQYRKLAEQLNIVSPRAAKSESLEEMLDACQQMNFPVIVKPVDLTGGKGILRCETIDEIPRAYESAATMTRENYVIVEEFVMGTNHGFSAYIQEGKVTFYFADNEQYYHNPYLVSGASTPGDIPETAIRQLCTDCERMAAELNLVDGILHIQLILREDGEPVIIEICRRAPGDLYIELVQRSTGLDYPRYIVAAEAGLKMSLPEYHVADGYYVRHCVMADAEGYIDHVEVAEELKRFIEREFFWYQPGAFVADRRTYKAGIVFLHFPTKADYHRYMKKLTTLIRVILQ